LWGWDWFFAHRRRGPTSLPNRLPIRTKGPWPGGSSTRGPAKRPRIPQARTTASWSTPDSNDRPLYIGNNSDYPERGFTGVIGEVKIYDRALSADEIAKQYEKTK
jgi:hypothetical protein